VKGSITKTLAGLAAIGTYGLGVVAPALADSPDELAGCRQYTTASMPFGGGWAGPQRTVPRRSACEDINVQVLAVDGSGVYARAEYTGAASGWTYVYAGIPTAVARDVPGGVTYRVLFISQVRRFAAYD
jgi:hypothetical protein